MPQWLGRHKWLWLVAAVMIALLAFAACDGDEEEGGSPTAAGETPAGGETPTGGAVEALAAIGFPESARVFLREALEQGLIDQFLFVDGTKSQAMFDDLGVENFEGMSGTAPGAADPEAGAQFDAAYTAATGSDTAGLAFLREGYDAAYLIALAAVAANSHDSTAIRDHLRYVANPPGDEVGFGADEFARAVEILQGGGDINYTGAAGPVDLDANGDVAKGAIETWKIVDGKITTQDVRELDVAALTGTEVPAGELNPAATAPTDPLKIGTVTSLTGDLSDFGQPIADAIQMAIDEINEAGGVFGQPVPDVVVGDDATNDQQGRTAAQQLIEVDGVHAIIGSLSSGVTLPIAENVTGPASVVQISPASTSPALTTANDNDFLFRTTISDAAQGLVLADLANELGLKTVCTLFVNTPYGQGLSENFATAFEALGGSVPQQVPHEQEQTTYVTELQRCVGG